VLEEEGEPLTECVLYLHRSLQLPLENVASASPWRLLLLPSLLLTELIETERAQADALAKMSEMHQTVTRIEGE
jgi:hypothetical protein